MHFNLVLAVSSLLFITFCHHDFIPFVNGGNPPEAAQDNMHDAAINCGSIGNSIALDGREWIGDAPSRFLSGHSGSSTAAQNSFSVDPVPYRTSRISDTGFSYTFEVNPGQKFIRFHFYPASYSGFENSVDFFTVKAGPFTLLRDFSASLAAEIFGVKYLVKEFCLNVQENTKLNISFSPSHNSKSKENIYAFVNGIEIISMPAGLYYTHDGDLGARIVSQRNRFYSIDNSTALEVIQRLNIGGSSISSVEDFGMFRRWSEDVNYLLESGVHRVNHPPLSIKYTNMPAFIAPPKLYQTAWKIGGNIRVNQTYNFTWKIPVELGFGYLIRLHFCKLDDGMAESELSGFTILINDQIAETQADVTIRSGGNGIPIYRDYMVKMKGDKGGECDLLVALQSAHHLVFGLLNGLEIFKLSNLENSLATPNHITPKIFSTSSTLNAPNLSLAISHINVILTSTIVLVILVNAIAYYLRQIREEKFRKNNTEATTTEPSYHRFSLAEIISSTQNFSEAFCIGRGGFGKVYKAYIPAIQEIVAIKRLSSYSRQGAHEFWTEIKTLSKLRHVHLLSLIGYCNEGEEMILVYAYMPHGTLAENIHKRSRMGKDIAPLSWEQRLTICIGAARGLDYLHTGSECGVIHRDVKDTNILLDENLVAKISDFGLSKLENLTQSRSYLSTKVKGTFGYLDPDYLRTHRLTRKSDVYAFGVVLLVVLAGKPAVDTRTPEEPQSLLSCFRECIAKGDIERIVDPSLQGKFSSNSLREFLKSVENCLHHLPKKRPTMAQVVVSLEQALQYQKSTMISASGDTTVDSQHFEERTLETMQVLEKSVIYPSSGGITSKPIQDLVSPTSRVKDYVSVRKSLWAWPRKAACNLGKTMKITCLEVANSSGPCTSTEEQANKPSHCYSFGEQYSPRFSFATHLRIFSFSELKAATRNFRGDTVVGDGGFGKVYKGWLDEKSTSKNGSGTVIAVKKLKSDGMQGFNEWQSEVHFLGRVSHPNLIKLLGYCRKEKKLLLVYEFMQKGSLYNHLFERDSAVQPLPWEMRLKISIGAARGLAFLHAQERQIIHRDFKSSNILLDGSYNARIADFGLTIYGPTANQSHVSTHVVGTYGYFAPEYVATGHLYVKSDVYGFGVVLVEMLTGLPAMDNKRLKGKRNLIDWKKPHLCDRNKLKKMMDSRLEGRYPSEAALQIAQLALKCLEPVPKNRPSMKEVVEMLERIESASEKPTDPLAGTMGSAVYQRVPWARQFINNVSNLCTIMLHLIQGTEDSHLLQYHSVRNR